MKLAQPRSQREGFAEGGVTGPGRGNYGNNNNNGAYGTQNFAGPAAAGAQGVKRARRSLLWRPMLSHSARTSRAAGSVIWTSGVVAPSRTLKIA